MIKDFDTDSSTPRAAIVLKEILAHIAWGALLPLGIQSSKKRTARESKQRTVVFIHGYVSNRASFFPLSTFLKAVGVGQALSFNYSSKIGVEQAAIQLRDFLKEKVRGGRIDLVCHSLGGVIARVYLQELGGSRRVDRCITLGTPHRGTYNSYWAPTRIGKELKPDSSLMVKLQASRAKAARVKFTSIVGGADNIVIPRVFAADSEDVVHIPNLGHVGMLFSPNAFFEVAKRLKSVTE